MPRKPIQACQPGYKMCIRGENCVSGGCLPATRDYFYKSTETLNGLTGICRACHKKRKSEQLTDTLCLACGKPIRAQNNEFCNRKCRGAYMEGVNRPDLRKHNIEAGQVFGKLTTIEYTRVDSKGQWLWECRCECGNTTYANQTVLVNGDKKSCGCLYVVKIEAGEQFGKLTAIQPVDSEKDWQRLCWLFQCECGNQIVREVWHAVKQREKGIKQCCGCVEKGLDRSYARKKDSLINNIIHTYKHNAKTRNLPFELTKEQCHELFQGDCYYCGAKPSRVKKNSYAEYAFNGIDRLNNDHGYFIGNTVSCCTHCNYKKGSQHHDEFIDWLKKVARNLNL